jgi:aryl-alcohol dehydrogenase-like predicted oxidoreductase
MFQGEEWQKNQDFMDELRAIALDIEKTVSQIVINWTIHRPGITSALCGAKRPAQIKESAGGMGWKLDAQQLQSIDAAIRSRGPIVSASAV